MPSYPPPKVPLHPVLTLRSSSVKSEIRPSSVLSAGRVEFTSSGRASIALALQRLGLQSPFSVLLPAYHCIAMVEPVVWIGGTPVFYRLREDLSPDLGDLVKKCDASTKVVLVPHYFGFLQDLASLRRICNERGLVLIEDCAHAFFGGTQEKPVGTIGDFAIASPWKFFPSVDGGCLVSKNLSSTARPLVGAGTNFEVKAFLNAVERALNYDRLGPLQSLLSPLMATKDRLWKVLKRRKPQSQEITVAADGGHNFDGASVDRRMAWFSRWLLNRADMGEIALIRRRNYLRLHEELAGLAGTRPLFPTLPNNTVPYVYPLFVESPEGPFARLKLEGVPILRFGEDLWQGVDATTCPISQRLSRSVLQFPCHQALTDNELGWIIARVRAAITHAP